MKWEEMAYQLLTAPAQDAVRLAGMESPDPQGLDLRALVEYEHKPGGAVRVRLLDRGALLGALLRAGLGEAGDPEEVAALFRALEGAAGAVPQDII